MIGTSGTGERREDLNDNFMPEGVDSQGETVAGSAGPEG
jgi:hypothetical protein